MTKLEEKLLELGYEKHVGTFESSLDYCTLYRKPTGTYGIQLEIIICENKIYYSGLSVNNNLSTQEQIDNLQQAFNILQQDLEVLKEYENS